MDLKDGIYSRKLQEQDMAGLAEMCGNVARTRSADDRQSETAHKLRAEWVRVECRRHDDRTESEKESLKKRMVEFLSGVPEWMLSGA